MKRSQARQIDSRREVAFSLVELLVVMAIIGVLAAIGLPALRGLSGANDVASANRQLLDDLSYARFKAINERTTVYVVFLSQDILRGPWSGQKSAEVAKLANMQYTSYALYANRSLGDQPGAGTARYLTEWKTLPEGVFIFTNKFDSVAARSPASALSVIPLEKQPFSYVSIPFPTATDPQVRLPVIAFDYQGKLVSPDGNGRMRQQDLVIPFVKGSIVYPQDSRDPVERASLKPAEVIETPKKNYTNNPVIRIDWLTGRARSIRPENVNWSS